MRSLLLATALSVAALAGCTKSSSDQAATKAEPAAAKAEEFPAMTPDEVDKALASKDVVPVDCNGERTRKKLGVVPGAIIISDEELFVKSELPADPATKLVFYCADPG
jgi:ABC-type Fe3+-hydroxamate transport system substrate-binding protein